MSDEDHKLCRLCGKALNGSDSCESWRWASGLPAVPWGKETGVPEPAAGERCPDCGVLPGGYHHPLCVLEENPNTGQLAIDSLRSEFDDRFHDMAVFGLFLDEYSLQEVCVLTEATRSQVENYVRSKFVTPKRAKKGGTGHHRKFSFKNLLDLAVAVRIARFHVPMPALLKDLDSPGFRHFLTYADTFLAKTDEELVAELLSRDEPEERARVLRDESERVKESAASWRKDLEYMRRFLTPETRPEGEQLWLRIWHEGGEYVWDWEHGKAVEVWDAALVINLREIIETLEFVTNDRWRDD